MKLTPIKVLIESLTPDYFKALEEYEEAMEEADKLGLRVPEKPKGKDPEYKLKYYNFDHYIMDSWSTDWDPQKECAIIVAIWFHIHSSSFSIMNIQMTESEWIELLKDLGYSCK